MEMSHEGEQSGSQSDLNEKMERLNVEESNEKNGEEREGGEDEEDCDVQLAGLTSLPSKWLGMIVMDEFGLDDVIEMTTSMLLPHRTRKCLLLLKLRKYEALACAVCNKVYFNYIHYLIHSTEKEHYVNLVNKGTLPMYTMWEELDEVFDEDVDEWKHADEIFGNGEDLFQSLRMNPLTNFEKIRRPTNEFLTQVRKDAAVADLNADPESRKIWTQEKKHEVVERMCNHLSTGTSVCSFCNEAFTGPFEFYRHCLTYGHYKSILLIHNRDSLAYVMKDLSMIMNQLGASVYYEYMKDENCVNPSSAENCWETIENFEKQIPHKRKPRHFFDPERQMYLLKNIRPTLNGKSIDYVKSLPEGEELIENLEPSEHNFSLFYRKLQRKYTEFKAPLHYASTFLFDTLRSLYRVMYRTIDKGIPHCFYCNLVFSTVANLFDHISSFNHGVKYASYCEADPSILESCHDCLNAVLFHFLQGKKKSLSGSMCEIQRESFLSHTEHERLLYSSNLSYQCDTCDVSFVDFTYFIAHFWSKSHIDRLPRLNDPNYIPYMLQTATNEQLSRISKEIKNKYSTKKSVNFHPQSHGKHTRDYYLTHYIHFHFRRKFEGWRDKQINNKRDKGTPSERSADCVPSIEMEAQINEKMKMRMKRADYEWISPPNSLESKYFHSFYSTLPPLLIWNELDSHMKREGKIPFCSLCNLSFSKPENYYLHVVMDNHLLPNAITDPLAGLTLLIHIMYREKKTEFDPNAYISLSPL